MNYFVDGKYIIKGDVNCDQKIDIEDLIPVYAHLERIIGMTGDSEIAFDVNNDNDIDNKDAVLITEHIYGYKMITEVIEK